jgi:hypothetical protein
MKIAFTQSCKFEKGEIKKKTRKTKLSLQLFLMANFDRVNGPIDMRVWKGRRFENILKLDNDLR